MTEIEKLDIKARTLSVTVKSLTMVNENLVKANKDLSEKLDECKKAQRNMEDSFRRLYSESSALAEKLDMYKEDNCILADYTESLEKEVDSLRNEILEDAVVYNELLEHAMELEKTANKYYELKNKIEKYIDDGR